MTERMPIAGAIIFSLEDDIVYLTLPFNPQRIALGDCETVTYMMRDFLGQCDLGDAMARRFRARPTNGA